MTSFRRRWALHGALFSLAVPNILSNISVPLLSSVDTGLMGTLSAAHIGAVGIGAMLFNFLYWNMSFLRMGTTGLTAQAYGRGDDQEVGTILGRALLLALLLGGLLLLLRVPLFQLGAWLMNVPMEQYELVATYFYSRLLAAPATILLMTIMGWFFGLQNAWYPLVLTILINTCNIVLSYVLVIQYDYGVAGVAYGTVGAQYVGVSVGLLLIIWRYKVYWLTITWDALLHLQAFRNFLTINRDIFLRTFCLTVVFGFFYSQSAQAGAQILAVQTILMQFLSWMSFGVDGFAYAAESLVGKYIGAEKPSTARRAVGISMGWGMSLALLYSLIYGIFGPFFIGLFTDQTTVYEAALPYLPWLMLAPILGTPCYIWDGVYVGLTAVKTMRNSMMGATLIFVLGYWMLRQGLDLDTPTLLWSTMLLFFVARGGIQTWYYQQYGLALR